MSEKPVQKHEHLSTPTLGNQPSSMPQFVEIKKPEINLQTLEAKLDFVLKDNANTSNLSELKGMLNEYKILAGKINANPGWEGDALAVSRRNAIYEKKQAELLADVNKILSEVEKNSNSTTNEGEKPQSQLSHPLDTEVARLTKSNPWPLDGEQIGAKQKISEQPLNKYVSSRETVDGADSTLLGMGEDEVDFRRAESKRKASASIDEVKEVDSKNEEEGKELTTEYKEINPKDEEVLAAASGGNWHDTVKRNEDVSTKNDTPVPAKKEFLADQYKEITPEVEKSLVSVGGNWHDAVVKSEAMPVEKNTDSVIEDASSDKKTGWWDKDYRASRGIEAKIIPDTRNDLLETTVGGEQPVIEEIATAEGLVESKNEKSPDNSGIEDAEVTNRIEKSDIVGILDKNNAVSREKLPISARERANKMAKVLAVSLAGYFVSTQPTGQQAEAFSNNTYSTVGAESLAGIDSGVGELSGVAPETLQVDLPKNQDTTKEYLQNPAPVELVDVAVDEVPAYESSVPPLVTEVASETPLIVVEAVEGAAETVPEELPHIVESVEAGTLMIEVPKDSTVSNAVEDSYKAGLFDSHLTKTFDSTKEFMDAYWAFDELINKNPDVVKEVLQISSGNTDIIKAGGTFNVLPILAVINGEQTVEQIALPYSAEVAAVEVVDSEINVAAKDELKGAAEETPVVSEMFVTPEAVEAYKVSYEGGEEAWKRDFETFVRNYLPTKGSEGWFSNWFSASQESVADIFDHVAESKLTVSEFNALRDGDARTLRNYLRESSIPIADFRDLQTMLYEIGMEGRVQILDDMSILQVLEEAFVVRHASLNINAVQK